MPNFWGTFWPLISNFYLSLFFIYLTDQCWGSKIVTKSAWWFCKLLFFLEHGIIFSVQVLFSPYIFALCSGSVHCVSWDCDILLQQSANLPMDPWHLSVGGISVLQGYWDNHQVSMLNTFPWPREVSFGNFKLFRYSVLKQSLFLPLKNVSISDIYLQVWGWTCQGCSKTPSADRGTDSRIKSVDFIVTYLGRNQVKKFTSRVGLIKYFFVFSIINGDFRKQEGLFKMFQFLMFFCERFLMKFFRLSEFGVPSCEDVSLPLQDSSALGQSPLSHHRSFTIRSPLTGDR